MRIPDRRGQAAVEYILMLVIIVSLILGAKKAFTNVNNFMTSYMGDYVACLMEYGELPSLNVGEASLKKHVGGGGSKVCDAKFSDFTFTGGVAATGGGGSGSNGGNSSRNGRGSDGENSSAADSKKSSRNASKGGSGSSDINSGAKDGAAAGRSAKASQSNRLKRSSNAYGTADNRTGMEGKVKVIEDEEGAKKRNRRKGRYRPTRYVYSGGQYRAINGAMAADLEKSLPKKPLRTPSSKVSKGAEGFGLRPTTKTFIPKELNFDQRTQSEDSGFSFGNFFKWLLIGGMIIAIVIFFGGQLLNYSNSQD